MTIIKCKICGGDMTITADKTVGICDYCGSTMTLPKINDDVIAAMFNRGNHFRMSGEFDKALSVYERIVDENPNDAEAHWCCALCRFGIEWVEDPLTTEFLPTCHRASFDSFLEDIDYLAALENSDGITHRQYQKDAQKIAEVQRGILATSQNEEPFDVFICYKETDDTTKQRTRDSIDAQEIYYQLTNEGYRVFFSRITLEDKTGAEYEPYIFAALNSAKVMIVIGSKQEYFNAVWVKNEWSRFLALMRRDRTKILLPCFKGIDPYDLPEQLSVLQSYDMAKIGFIQDLIRGIKKIVEKEGKKAPVKEKIVPVGNMNIAPLLERAFLFLEDGKWQEANTYCEKVLDNDPKNAEAYLGKLMAELQVKTRKQLADYAMPFDDRDNYGKVTRFGDEKLKSEMRGYIHKINERNENLRLVSFYNNAISAMNAAETESTYKALAATFNAISGFQDADELAEQCLDKAEVCRKNAIYASAQSEQLKNNITGCENAIKLYESISGWKNSNELICVCRKKIEEIETKGKKAKKRRKTAIIGTLIIVVVTVLFVIFMTVILPYAKYSYAVNLYKAGKYNEAKDAFSDLNGYKDSKEQITKCESVIKYNAAVDFYTSGKYSEAYKLFNSLEYNDSADKAAKCLFLKQKAELADIAVGSTLNFGSYEQDNNTSNGKEEIQWKVLAIEGYRALVISQYALDCMKYNTSYTGTTWGNCTLRIWLNETFYNTAFSPYHQKLIASSTITADVNSLYSTSIGNDTTDYVFLLSIAEANDLFFSRGLRKCTPTKYAEANGADYSGGACWWWLRSSRKEANCVAIVNSEGSVNESGIYSNYSCAVRPALWIYYQTLVD